MPVEIKWLEDFLALASTLNFSKAADERHVTQSAFSRRIRQLEAWLGATLVDRATYPSRLTEAGAKFVPVAQETLKQLYQARRNLQQAYSYLEKYALAPRIATIGWDLGGGWSLQTALEYPGALDAAVMYYGQILTERDRLAPLNVPLLGFFGAEDRSIPVRSVQEFRATLADLGKTAEVLIMPRAGHGFAIPNSAGYNVKAANEAWETTLAFLERNLKLATPTRAQ